MKIRTVARLDMMAAEREAQALAAIGRHNAAVQHSEAQLEMLAAYRDRLAASWQNGAVVSASQAHRAGRFVTSAQGAEAQVHQAAKLAAGQLTEAIGTLGQIKAHRRALAKNLREWAQAQERAAEQARERDLPTTRRR